MADGPAGVERVLVLKSFGLLADVPPDELAALAERVEFRRYEAGASLVGAEVEPRAHFVLTGDVAMTFHWIIRDGTMTHVVGEHAEPSAHITMPATDFADAFSGRTMLRAVYMSGAVKFKGNFDAVRDLGEYLPHLRI